MKRQEASRFCCRVDLPQKALYSFRWRLSCWFRRGVLSLLVLNPAAALATSSGSACWYPFDIRLLPEVGVNSIRTYGVFKDPISALDALTPSRVEEYNAYYEALYLFNGLKCRANPARAIDESYPPGSDVSAAYHFTRAIPGELVLPSKYPPEYCEAIYILAMPLSQYSWMAPNLPADISELLKAKCSSAVRYKIRLSNETEHPAVGRLAEVEPGVTSTTLRARVYDSNGQIVFNVPVQLQVSVDTTSGGHSHPDDKRPKGTLISIDPNPGAASGNDGVLTGSTAAADGSMQFSFESPAAAGDHTIEARCMDRDCSVEGPSQVWVGVKDLVSIPSSGFWSLYGGTGIHPANHYLNSDALGKLIDLAQLYTQVYFPFRSSTPVLQLNDASLERGGVFDIYWENTDTGEHRTDWWTPPHKEHQRGVVIDIQANGSATAIPQRNFADFQDLLRRQHMTWNPERLNQSGGHYHVRLLGVAQ